MRKGDDPIDRVETPKIAPPLALKDADTPTKKARSPGDTGQLKLPTPPRERKPKATQEKPLPGTTLAGHVKPGPPVYKQAWFWAIIGGVAVAAVVIPIVVPKEQRVTLGQTPIFHP